MSMYSFVFETKESHTKLYKCIFIIIDREYMRHYYYYHKSSVIIFSSALVKNTFPLLPFSYRHIWCNR